MTFIPAPKKTYVQATIWARVSSEEQRSGHSIDTQIANGKKYCDERNLYVIDTIDAVESSNKEVRHKFLAMIEFVEKQKEPINLVIQSVDRLHRDSKSFSTILALKDKGKLIIHCTRDGAVYYKYNNDIVYQMQHMMANLETKTLGSRVITGFARKAEEGTILGQVAV